MKLEPCIILKLVLNFSDSEPEYSYKIYSYKACPELKDEMFFIHSIRSQIRSGPDHGKEAIQEQRKAEASSRPRIFMYSNK